MAVVSMRELLEGGVHFGHQTRRWNPKMRRYIFGERGGIYIIDLQRTLALLEEAAAYSRNVAERGGTILFVGTKKQAQDIVEQEAKRVSMPYVNQRWLGGLLTNWRTISERIERLHELRRLRSEGQLELLPPKERMSMLAELEKLDTNLGGVANMRSVPDAVFVLDLNKEEIAVREARRLGLPVLGLVDTNSDPDDADLVIPGNDDAIRSCSLIVRVIAQAIADGQAKLTVAEARAKIKAEEEAAAAARAAEAAEAAEAAAAQAVEKAEGAESAPSGEAPADQPKAGDEPKPKAKPEGTPKKEEPASPPEASDATPTEPEAAEASAPTEAEAPEEGTAPSEGSPP
jgi:small subunit ribosomal protein S2